MNYVTDVLENKENVVEEIWRDVPGYESLYKVSNLGNVLSFHNKKYPEGRPMKTHTGNTGYVKLTMCDNESNHKLLRLNRIVCEAFHGTPANSKMQANHIDGNKQNNSASNLEWNTPSQNTVHAYVTGLINSKVGNKKRPVIQKSLDNIVLTIHPSVTSAGKAVNGESTGVKLACQNKLKTYKGYIWNYADETEMAQ